MDSRKRKEFGRKASVEWVFPWQGTVGLKVKVGDQIRRGDCLFSESGKKTFLSPIDGRVLEINEKKKELILGFKAFEFLGKSRGEFRVWAEAVVGEKKTFVVDEVEGKIVVFGENNLILIAKIFALGAAGTVFFAEEGNAEDYQLSSPFLVLEEKEKEKFLSVLKLMEKPVLHLDTKMARLLLTENKRS